MRNEERWGPWTEHVPGPCPAPVGTRIQIRDRDTGLPNEGTIHDGSQYRAFSVRHRGWFMFHLRYRVRMDREHSGMSVLRELLNGIPVKEMQDA